MPFVAFCCDYHSTLSLLILQVIRKRKWKKGNTSEDGVKKNSALTKWSSELTSKWVNLATSSRRHATRLDSKGKKRKKDRK